MSDGELSAALTGEVAERAWDEVVGWTDREAENRYREFCQRQSGLAALATNLLEDQPDEVFGLAIDLLLALDRTYELASGRLAASISEWVITAAFRETEARFHAASQASSSPTTFADDLTAGDVAGALAAILEAVVDEDPDLDPADSAPRLHFLLFTAARSFERNHGIAPEQAGSTTQGHGKVGRNEPCPCGSGKKFKRCCGLTSRSGIEVSPSPAQLKLAEYVACADQILTFAEDDRSSDGLWLSQQIEALEEEFESSEVWEVIEPAVLNFALYDLELPRSRVSMAALFARNRGRVLDAKLRRIVRELGESYLAFYQLTGRSADTLQFRELVSGEIWSACDPDAPPDAELDMGEIWLCRFVGAHDDAIAFTQPIVYEPEAAAQIELAASTIFDEIRAASPEGGALSFAAAMKRAGEEILAFIALGAGDGDGPEHDEESDEEVDDAPEGHAPRNQEGGAGDEDDTD